MRPHKGPLKVLTTEANGYRYTLYVKHKVNVTWEENAWSIFLDGNLAAQISPSVDGYTIQRICDILAEWL